MVTSGLGGFPRDFPVGKVSRVVQSAAGLYQEVEVTPDVDFARLSEVLVVVAPPPAPDPDAGARPGACAPGARAVAVPVMRALPPWPSRLVLLLLQSVVLELAAGARADPGLRRCWWPCTWACRRSGRSRRRCSWRSRTGYLFDLVSGAPAGVHAFVFVLMALLAAAAGGRGWPCAASCCRRRPASWPACWAACWWWWCARRSAEGGYGRAGRSG